MAKLNGAPLSIGIMSFAHPHAFSYIQELQKLGDVDLLACDPGPYAAEELLRGRNAAEQFGVRYVDTYEELFAWDPDGVIVTSENARHRDLVVQAAQAGADILCEKPLATTLADAEIMRSAVETAGVRLMIAFPVRFSSAFTSLKAAYDSGALGSVVAIRGSNNGQLPLFRDWFTDPALAGGGALVDHIVHIADLVEALTSSAPRSVTAIANRTLFSNRAQSETAGLVTITYDDGSIVAIDCSWSQPAVAQNWGNVKVSVLGTRGTADLDFFGAAVHGLDSATGLPVEIRYGAELDPRLLKEFIRGIRQQRQPQPDWSAGYRTLQIVVAAQESVATGRTITIEG